MMYIRVHARHFQIGILEPYGMYWNMIIKDIINIFRIPRNRISIKAADLCVYVTPIMWLN